MASTKKPRKWYEVYDDGEEQRFFVALARHPQYDWRSTSALAKEAKITPERCEEIIKKYLKKGLIFQNPANEDQWGYWERVPQMLDDDKKTVAAADQEDRLDKAMGCVSSAFTSGPTLALNTASVVCDKQMPVQFMDCSLVADGGTPLNFSAVQNVVSEEPSETSKTSVWLQTYAAKNCIEPDVADEAFQAVKLVCDRTRQAYRTPGFDPCNKEMVENLSGEVSAEAVQKMGQKYPRGTALLNDMPLGDLEDLFHIAYTEML